jgi:uncharacterized membrane protein
MTKRVGPVAKDKEIEHGRFLASISYISLLCILSLVFKKDNKFALHHAKQGLVLFALEVSIFILSIIPLLNWPAKVSIIAFFVVSLWGISGALMGHMTRLPGISAIADNIVF